MALASVAQASSDVAQAKAALEAARRFDPTQSDPVQKLALLAAHSGDKNAELELLRKLAELEQHDPRVYKRLLTLLVEKKAFAEARTVGEAAIYADLEGLETHVLFAQALSETGQLPRAVFELESALLCPGEPREYAEVHIRLAELQLKSKNRARATHHAREAQRLDPNNPKLGTLKL
jgi:tetratricopeptide (TPR) repeat protein